MSIYFFNGDWSNHNSKILLDCFIMSIKNEHQLSAHILNMSGMSGKKYRFFINNLIKKIENTRYLEIGSWAGSTACSAMFNNSCKITCIDNWSQFGGPKEIFFQNVESICNNKINFDFIESNFYDINFSNIGKYNIYLYDGSHEEEDQFQGIVKAQEALDDEYFLIIDDWNWDFVRHGTIRAINILNSHIISSIEIRTTLDNSHPQLAHEHSDWHNGYYLAYIKKSQ